MNAAGSPAILYIDSMTAACQIVNAELYGGVFGEIEKSKVLKRILLEPWASSKPDESNWYHHMNHEPQIPPSLYNIPRSGKTVLGDRMRSLFKQGTTEYVWSGGQRMGRNTAMANYFKGMKPIPADLFPRKVLNALLRSIYGVH